LGGIYHQRPSYPWQQQQREERSDDGHKAGTGTRPADAKRKKDKTKGRLQGRHLEPGIKQGHLIWGQLPADLLQ
jgi:hypothetical protein